jgi:hypothetical protein
MPIGEGFSRFFKSLSPKSRSAKKLEKHQYHMPAPGSNAGKPQGPDASLYTGRTRTATHDEIAKGKLSDPSKPVADGEVRLGSSGYLTDANGRVVKAPTSEAPQTPVAVKEIEPSSITPKQPAEPYRADLYDKTPDEFSSSSKNSIFTQNSRDTDSIHNVNFGTANNSRRNSSYEDDFVPKNNSFTYHNNDSGFYDGSSSYSKSSTSLNKPYHTDIGDGEDEINAALAASAKPGSKEADPSFWAL